MNSYYYRYETDYRPWDGITWAVQRLIVLSTVVFAAQLVANVFLTPPPLGGDPFSWLAFRPDRFLRGALWQPFTYVFLHAGLMHLFMNMLWLFFFGPDVERVLGTRQFFTFYLVCGAVGVLAAYLPLQMLGLTQAVSVIGGSGAVMGVLVAFALTSPERQFFLFPLPIPINARGLVILVIAMNVVTALLGDGTTSVATHFGGMFAGFAYMKTVPVLRRWQFHRHRPRKQARDKLDVIGDAVDNIFKLEDERRRRK